MLWIFTKLGPYTDIHWTQQPGPAPPPPHSSGSGLLWVLLALLAPIIALTGTGFALGLRKRKPRIAAPALAQSSLVASESGYQVLRPELPDVPSGNGSQKQKMFRVLFATRCKDCGASPGSPCTLKRGKRTLVDEDTSTVVHFSRVEDGCKDNPQLYVELMANWVGPVPEYMKGLR